MLINPPLKLIDPGLKVVGDVGGLTLQKPRDNFRKGQNQKKIPKFCGGQWQDSAVRRARLGRRARVGTKFYGGKLRSARHFTVKNTVGGPHGAT